MDFCPSESFDSVEKCPDSPFVAACCHFEAASPEIEEEIRSFLAGRGKTPAARVEASRFLRKKIDAGELGMQALCLVRTAENMLYDGLLNCIPEESRKFTDDLPHLIALNAAEWHAEKFAEELSTPKKRVIRMMTSHMMAHACAVGFLEKDKMCGTLTPGKLHVIIDKIPGGGNKIELFEAVGNRLQAARKANLEAYGVEVVVTPLDDRAADPCGVLIADCLASITTGITEYLRNPEHDDGSPIVRADNLPKYSDEQREEIKNFSDYLLRNKRLLHVTTEMLMGMANLGPDMTRQILDLQHEFGLGYTRYMNPYEFVSPEAKGHKFRLFPIYYVRNLNRFPPTKYENSV